MKDNQKRELVTKNPFLIQRCELEYDPLKLRYDYMGSSEFECGYQAKALREMFTGTLVVENCSVNIFGKKVSFWMIACNDFDFAAYHNVINGLAEKKWSLQEPTYLDLVLKKKLGIVSHEEAERWSFVDRIVAWFDFHNQVLFAHDEAVTRLLLKALLQIKEKWLTPDPPKIVKFKRDLERVKAILKRSGKEWFSLDRVEDCGKDGVRVWLNPYEQQIHDWGWFTLQDLRDWAHNKGPIMKRVAQ